jgi:lipopolysaccharide biosynthesis glycosyltransferase
MKKHAIITACNEKYGDFLTSQWYRSLYLNVNLKSIDVVIFDYGLNRKQLQKIAAFPVAVIKQKAAVQIVTHRFIDTANYLIKSRYDQILLVDCGDIIFQRDIEELFNKDKDTFRAVKLDLEVLFNEIFIPGSFTKTDGLKIYQAIKAKEMINAGFIIGPRKKMVILGQKINRLVEDKNRYGPDQIALNYILYQYGVKLLPREYNYMVNNVREKIQIKNGFFYSADGKLIPVVHNAGHKGMLRPVFNFGYGPGYNRLNSPIYQIKRYWYRNLKYLKPVVSLMLNMYLSNKQHDLNKGR